ncbi:competence/damage-inducible protein A [Opitutales bacterium]|uniref:competence/damage-inducible protein A n=1 Tax=Candidatus Seribacter sulfatis TaxID=3381756 RepID=UPI002A0D1AB9|nr:competence/damage-inducible protein A [Opitutales bacterium]
MSSNIRVETITLGDELLLGIRENTHLTYLGNQLAHHGLEPAANLVIRDNPEDIRLFFSEAWKRSDLVITTGGLGPTTDDITRENIAQALGEELVFDPVIETALKDRFKQLARPMPEINLRQCYRLGNSEILENPYGTAPGIWLKKDNKILVMLPGPAREMHPMFEEQVIPRLQKEGIFPEIDCYLQIRTAGIGESTVAEKVEHLFEGKKGLIIGYCAHAGMVDIRLSSLDSDSINDQDLHNLADACRDALGEDFVCLGDRTIAEVIFREVRNLNKTIAVAESCTGGLLSSSFTEIPGISKVFHGGAVCYHNDAKVQMLDVPESMIEQHGAVSEEVAIAMATGACEKYGADYGLSVTGFAGPTGGTQVLPVGSIYLGYASPVGVWAKKIQLRGDRASNRRRAATAALDWMRRKLRKYKLEEVFAAAESGEFNI